MIIFVRGVIAMCYTALFVISVVSFLCSFMWVFLSFCGKSGAMTKGSLFKQLPQTLAWPTILNLFLFNTKEGSDSSIFDWYFQGWYQLMQKLLPLDAIEQVCNPVRETKHVPAATLVVSNRGSHEVCPRWKRLWMEGEPHSFDPSRLWVSDQSITVLITYGKELLHK